MRRPTGGDRDGRDGGRAPTPRIRGDDRVEHVVIHGDAHVHAGDGGGRRGDVERHLFYILCVEHVLDRASVGKSVSRRSDVYDVREDDG